MYAFFFIKKKKKKKEKKEHVACLEHASGQSILHTVWTTDWLAHR